MASHLNNLCLSPPPMGQRPNRQSAIVNRDGLGSVRQLVDTTGSVGLAQTFDPYGTGYARSGSASSSFGYSGEQTDANGFVYLRARYYNPAYGRFFQRDAFRGSPNYPLTLNPYMFVLGNPILHVDPSGMCIFTGLDTAVCALLAAAGVGALVGAAASIGMYALACLGACGCELEVWAKNITLPEFVLMVALSAGMGALAGALVLAAPLAAPILGGIGAGFSVTDMIRHGVTWCNAIGLIASIAGGLAGATAPVPKSVRFNPSFVTNLGSTASLFRGWSISVTWATVTVIPADYAGVVSAPLVLALAGGPGGDPSGKTGGDAPRLSNRAQKRLEEVFKKDGTSSGHCSDVAKTTESVVKGDLQGKGYDVEIVTLRRDPQLGDKARWITADLPDGKQVVLGDYHDTVRITGPAGQYALDALTFENLGVVQPLSWVEYTELIWYPETLVITIP